MLTIRLENDLENEIERMAKLEGISKSKFVRRSIIEYIKRYNKPTLYQVGKDMFDKYNINDDKLSIRSEKILRNHFKHE